MYSIFSLIIEAVFGVERIFSSVVDALFDGPDVALVARFKVLFLFLFRILMMPDSL